MKIDDVWSAEREAGGWALVESKPGKTKSGDVRVNEVRMYYPTLAQCIKKVAERKMMDCPDLNAALCELRRFEVHIREMV